MNFGRFPQPGPRPFRGTGTAFAKVNYRPGLGAWLWLLTVSLGALPLLPVHDYVMIRVWEIRLPELRGMAEWPTAKAITLGLSVSALIAASIGMHALYAGTNSAAISGAPSAPYGTSCPAS